MPALSRAWSTRPDICRIAFGRSLSYRQGMPTTSVPTTSHAIGSARYTTPAGFTTCEAHRQHDSDRMSLVELRMLADAGLADCEVCNR